MAGQRVKPLATPGDKDQRSWWEIGTSAFLQEGYCPYCGNRVKQKQLHGSDREGRCTDCRTIFYWTQE